MSEPILETPPPSGGWRRRALQARYSVRDAAIYQGPLTRDTSQDFPKAAIDRFVQGFEDRVEVLHSGAQLVLRKRGAGSVGGSEAREPL